MLRFAGRDHLFFAGAVGGMDKKLLSQTTWAIEQCKEEGRRLKMLPQKWQHQNFNIVGQLIRHFRSMYSVETIKLPYHPDLGDKKRCYKSQRNQALGNGKVHDVE